MIKLLQRLFWRCRHRWVIHEQYSIAGRTSEPMIGVLYVLRCSRCGELKRFKAVN